MCKIWTTHDVIIHFSSITITLQPLFRMFSYLVRTWGRTTTTPRMFGCRRCVKFGESRNDNLFAFNHSKSSPTTPSVLIFGAKLTACDAYTARVRNLVLCQIWTIQDTIICCPLITITLQPLLRTFSNLVSTRGRTTSTWHVFNFLRCEQFGPPTMLKFIFVQSP